MGPCERIVGVIGLGMLVSVGGCRSCSKDSAGSSEGGGTGKPGRPEAGFTSSAPIAAAHAGDGSVLVGGVDLGSHTVRIVRIDADDRVGEPHVVLGDVGWSADAEMKLHVRAKEGAFVTWRGTRDGKLVRQLVRLDAELSAKGEPAAIPMASCATRDALWVADGSRAVSRPWNGAPASIELPREDDSSILCAASRGYAVVEDDERMSLLPLAPGAKPVEMLREKDFGSDERRDLAEYTVGDDVGVLRIADSGALAIRELHDAAASALHRLKTSIAKDDAVVAVDASADTLAIFYTHESSAGCDAKSGDVVVATNVKVVRVDRKTFEESVVDVASGKCGVDVGPFFTGVLGSAVSVAWAERAGGAGKPRAPIVGLVHATVATKGSVSAKRIEQPADVLVDAGCDGKQCYAVALVRPEGAASEAPGAIKVLRY